MLSCGPPKKKSTGGHLHVNGQICNQITPHDLQKPWRKATEQLLLLTLHSGGAQLAASAALGCGSPPERTSASLLHSVQTWAIVGADVSARRLPGAPRRVRTPLRRRR